MQADDDTADVATTNRRAFLMALSAAGVSGLAGCGGDDDTTDTEGGNGNGDTPTDTEGGNGNGDTPTDTEGGNGNGDTPTDTETPTQTSTPPEQDLGDPPAEILSLDAGLASPDTTLTLEGALLNSYLFDLQGIELSVTAPENWTVSPSDPVTIDSLPPGGSQEVSWEVSVPAEAEGQSTVTIDVHYESTTDAADITVEESIRVFTGDVPVEGLAAHYPLDSDTPTDAVGDNDATTNGGLDTGGTGAIGGAYEFDGSDDYLSYPDLGLTHDGSADWTTTMWINPNSLPGGDHQFLWHPRAKSDLNVKIDSSNSEIAFSTFDGSPNDLFSGVTPTTGEWTHVAVVCDTSADEQYRVFVDGTTEAMDNLPDPGGVSAVNVVGGQPNGTGGRFFDGLIDEVRFYDRALADEEVATLAGQGS
jgi:hypothetical protein